MSPRKYHLHDGRRGAALTVHVTSQANRNEITDIQPDGTVNIRLKVPIMDEWGNKTLIKFLSDVLGVTVPQIDIVGGITGNDKLLSILDIDTEEAHRRLLAYLK